MRIAAQFTWPYLPMEAVGVIWGWNAQAVPEPFHCCCGELLRFQPDGEGWRMQHGENPEHCSEWHALSPVVVRLEPWLLSIHRRAS